ncbi:antiviral RADAR system adenosine triphosphatase RdrA [Dickeya zeae]|uniref:antiviral RADAR system adenosine triphosphatase RdrA n=1 Tax=Dickeya zeae TaxID=204042 RepID=UPI00057724DB|nr:antiviral RADAR system adenosine triphosphatase RdrA [Dickeya zeae]
MVSEIILNLNLPEYQDDFLAETTDSNQLWQQQANRKLVGLLRTMGNDAHRYKTQCQPDSKETHQKLSSYHHAIFISGARGAGKTVFLKNAKAIWQHETDKQDKQERKPNLHFMPVIDPTLLNINERFSEVIIASVYAAVEGKLTNQATSQTLKDDFYHRLKDLSGALVKPSELAELRGIDRIQKYRSGIHLEQYFHQFLIASVRLLGCDALVLPIDDVDMKISNGFEVLDDIRCLLSCPLVLPLVSGDDKLYRHLVTLQFEGELVKNKEASNAEEGRREAMRLSDAYLTKVFPHPARLPLQPIDQLLPQLVIQDKEHAEPMTYGDYAAAIKRVFYPLCNGQERSTDWPQPANAREVTQLVRLLPPHGLKPSNNNQEALWRTFSHWAEAKQDGAALTNAESYLYLHTAQKPEDFSLARLIAFNPLLQKERYYWAKKHFYSQQVERINELKTASGRGEDFNRKILDTVFSENLPVLRSMPALEYIKEPLFLSGDVVKAELEARLFIALYTHHDYYSQQKGRRYHVFFSRAFEILTWSMLAVTNNLSFSNFSSSCDIKSIIGNVFKNIPFYSIFAMNPTKSIDENESGDDQTDDGEDKYQQEIQSFIEEIDVWIKANREVFADFSGKNLMPLITAVFNKVFTQLHILRSNFDVKKSDFSNEFLSDITKRFSYIFINALASFVRDGEVVNTNVAVSASSAVVRDNATFLRRDRTLVRNLKGLCPIEGWHTINEDGSFKHEDFVRLVNAMSVHPIFTLYDSSFHRIGLQHSSGVSGNVWSKVTSESKFSSMSVYDLKKDYFDRTGSKIIKTREVKEWAISQFDVAKLMFDRINELRDTDPKTRKWIDGKGYTSRLYNGLRQALDSKTKD